QPQPEKVIPAESLFRRYLFNPVAAAMILILIGSNLFWVSQVDTLNNQPPEVVMVTPTPMTDRLVYYHSEMGNNRVDIQDENTPGASLVWASRSLDNRWVGIFTTEGMNLPTHTETYQLWLIREDEAPMSVGIFGVDEDGDGMIIFEVMEAIDGFDLVGVTLEPAGGSPAPTSDPILAAEI
ncbi:MAG: anti-sigma factor, partial [Aggregatilineales bacterium]